MPRALEIGRTESAPVAGLLTIATQDQKARTLSSCMKKVEDQPAQQVKALTLSTVFAGSERREQESPGPQPASAARHGDTKMAKHL